MSPPRPDRVSPGGETHARLVDAEAARAHLRSLSSQGVGLRTVARVSGVPYSTLRKILYGDPRRGQAPSQRVREGTLDRILEVDATDARGGQCVSAAPSWALLDELLEAGYSRSELARALGSGAARPALQIGRYAVRASTARAIEELHASLLETD